MRIRVSDVLDLLADGLSTEQILEEMPDLGMDNLKAAFGTLHVSSIIRSWLHDDLGRCTLVACHCYLDRQYSRTVMGKIAV